MAVAAGVGCHRAAGFVELPPTDESGGGPSRVDVEEPLHAAEVVAHDHGVVAVVERGVGVGDGQGGVGFAD